MSTAHHHPVLEEALKLSPRDRLTLAQALWDSVEGEAPEQIEDPPLSEEWREEIRRRVQAVERGEVELLDGEEVLHRLREKYKA